MKLDTILIPLDGSALAEAGLPRALGLAAPRTTLVLLRAAEAASFPGRDPVDDQVRAVREAEEYLDGVAARLTREGAPRVETSVWYGPATSAIVEAARVRNADLIVMTTHGRSGLNRLVLGSVTEAVLRGTTVPILVVRDGGAPVESVPPAAREASRV